MICSINFNPNIKSPVVTRINVTFAQIHCSYIYVTIFVIQLRDMWYTKLSNNITYRSRTTEAWLVEAYKNYDIITNYVDSDGIYLCMANVFIKDSKSDRTYYGSIELNGVAASRSTQKGTGAYDISMPLCTVIECRANDKIQIMAQTNYIASGESNAGLAGAQYRLFKLPS